MKRSFFCFALCACLLLGGCNGQSDISAYQLYQNIANSCTIPTVEIYSYRSDLSHANIFAELYFRHAENSDYFDYFEDYLVCLYKGNEIWELHIFKTVSTYENQRVYELLLTRKDQLQSSENRAYYSQESLKRIEEATILSYCDFVILAITDDNHTIEEILKTIQ